MKMIKSTKINYSKSNPRQRFGHCAHTIREFEKLTILVLSLVFFIWKSIFNVLKLVGLLTTTNFNFYLLNWVDYRYWNNCKFISLFLFNFHLQIPFKKTFLVLF